MHGTSRRVSKRELFRLVGYEPHPGQVAVHRSKAKRRVLACGTRWGKSLASSMEAVAALLEPATESTGWVVAPSYGLTQRVFRKVHDAVREHFPHRILEIALREHRIVVRNLGGGRSEVVCKSADRPDGLLGAAVDWLLVDEAARVRDDVWDSYLAPRLIDRDGWALIVSTPRGVRSWFYRQYRRGLAGEPGYESWTAPSDQNPHLPEGAIEAERQRMSAETFAQEFQAEFLGDSAEPCLVCGGPSPDVPMVHITLDASGLDDCAECGEAVDSEGRTIVHRTADGRAAVTVIDLSWDGVEPVGVSCP